MTQVSNIDPRALDRVAGGVFGVRVWLQAVAVGGGGAAITAGTSLRRDWCLTGDRSNTMARFLCSGLPSKEDAAWAVVRNHNKNNF
jgi:hypothetical protein